MVCLASLSACSMLQEDKVDYTSAKRVSTLEVPPDLTQLNRDTRFAMPGNVVTASGYQASAPKQAVTTAATEMGDVRIERAGNQRWIVVKRPADKLWQPVRDFWQENGFVLIQDQETLGLMETDWAENRAKLPQDFIRNTLGKMLDSLYSTGERDKFRTRIERNAAGETEIYVSHRGMVEVFADKAKDTTMWQPRPADTSLETEFLRRLMVKLGVSQEVAKAQAASAPAQSRARLVGTAAAPSAVEVDDSFDRAWRRVGLALDRTGFTVEDRDRAKGIYFVRYVEPADPAAREPGLLSKLFSSSKPDAKPQQYRVQLQGNDRLTTVVVQNAQGEADTTGAATRIMKLLAEDLQ
ncbi:MAG: outer membrane protein assembly factor BamC [Burkholderiales bacterium]|nr:outer membrane protein assembly factor BamC [Burkholderiales bacterium]